MPSTQEPEVGIEHADVELASELALPEGDSVVCRKQKRFIDDRPWSLQASFYPMTLIQAGALRLLQKEEIPDGAVSYLKEKLNIKQVRYRDKITVRPPSDDEILFFKLPLDGRVAVFETRRTAFDEKRNPFRITVSVFPADRNQFIIEVDPADDRQRRPPRAV